MKRRTAALLAAAALAGCSPRPSPAPEPRYVVGEPYRMGGVWSYPREDGALSESGLAAVLPDGPRGRRTANGEVYDPAALVAAHRTVQLPSVLLVWNLDTGLAARVRVNDRGPEAPGRVVGLSRRAAALLGAGPGEPARVRIALDPEWSRAVADGLPGAGGPLVTGTAAPVAAVQREQLPPPPGARGAAVGAERGIAGPDLPATRVSSTDAPGPPGRSPRPARPPEEVLRRGTAPYRMVVEAGTFFRRDLADRRAAALGGGVEPSGSGRQRRFRVLLGPFATAGEADAALEAAFRRGAPDAKIVLD